MQGKVTVVTGAARGIGRAIVERYAREGALCAVADIDFEGARKASEAIEGFGGKAFPVRLDVTRSDSIKAMVETVVTRTGGIDILVNNAGVVEVQPIFEINEKTWERVLSVNVTGLFFTLQAVAKHMVDRGRGGKIINLASEAGQRAESLVIAYSATKAAVISITKTASLALIPHRINVNAISPGVVDTPMWEEVDRMFGKWRGKAVGETRRDTEREVPYGRFGKPEDLTGIAVFLATSDSDYMLGQTVNVDGGRVMK
ncbi:MAG TPA: L-iditol 2-dehydrogenase [Spirochaetia bacterium]|nr:L-iditol 2-dehydrogenase [Spirochaetia bacterium]